MAGRSEDEIWDDEDHLYRAIMSDPNIDELSMRLNKDGTKFQLKWKTATGPNNYHWFSR